MDPNTYLKDLIKFKFISSEKGDEVYVGQKSSG